MSTNAKTILFDECIGEPVMRRLQESVASEFEFVHITELYHQGIDDEAWIPDAAARGGSIVVTADGGRNPKGHKRKLPDLCLEFKLSHIILSASIHAEPSEKKLGVLQILWADIERAASDEPGSRYQIKYRNSRSIMSYAVELVKVDIEAAVAKRKAKKPRPK